MAKRPIHLTSLEDLLCVVQSDSGYIIPQGHLVVKPLSVHPVMRITGDDAEAEIIRRFKYLERKIRKLKKEMRT